MGTEDDLVEALFSKNYCDEEHMKAFARALSAVEEDHVPGSPLDVRAGHRLPQPSSLEDRKEDGYMSRSSIPRHVHHHEGQGSSRIRKVSAMSDFAPINTKVKRRKPRPRPSFKKEPLYLIFRWPLLVILFLVIAMEFGVYVLIRQLVNAFEWFLAWRGSKRRLRANMRNAKTWADWKQAAAVLDEYLGFDKWRQDEEDTYYDFELVRKVRRTLKAQRQRKDAKGLLQTLEVCLRDNYAGIESVRLYAESFVGTKDSIEDYLNEVESALKFIRTTDEITVAEKRHFYRNVNRNLGSSALCLSGGAGFGFYHFGVLKAFLEADMIPRVFNGTSAGGLTAAFACTHTDEELKLMMGPRLADHISCFEESWSTILKRMYKTGALYDTLAWTRKSTFFTRGSTTFKEAYERTGRVMNVSVIPSDQHSPTKLLNYLTAPDCVIWSAIIASSAVPGILNPVVLMQKTPSGHVVPWNWGSKFKDGSLRVDVPLQSLNLLFNVNYPIVSQVNPHIHLFWFAPRGSAGKPVAHRKGKGWRGGFLLSAAEQFLKLELTKNFKVIRDLDLMPKMLGTDWSSVWLQKFDGAVTIHPKIWIKDFGRMLTDPDRPNMARMQRAGELATWPTLHMVSNRFRLEQEILRGRMSVRRGVNAPSGRPQAAPREFTAPTNGAKRNVLPVANEEDTRSMRRGGDDDGPTAGQQASYEGAPIQRSSSQLAVESDAEEGFTLHSPRFFRQKHERRRHRSSRRNAVEGANATGRTNGSTGDHPEGIVSRIRTKSFPLFPTFGTRATTPSVPSQDSQPPMSSLSSGSSSTDERDGAQRLDDVSSGRELPGDAAATALEGQVWMSSDSDD